MGEVRDIRSGGRAYLSRNSDGPDDSDGGDGGDGMEERLRNVEQKLASIEATLPHLATKADVSDLHASIIRWLVGTMLGAAALAASIAFGLARLLA